MKTAEQGPQLGDLWVLQVEKGERERETLETQIQSSYVEECFCEWTKQINPWKHKLNQVMFNIDGWGSGVGDSY